MILTRVYVVRARRMDACMLCGVRSYSLLSIVLGVATSSYYAYYYSRVE